MMKVNLIGDYDGKYRISVIEWELVVAIVVMSLALIYELFQP